MRNLDTSHHPAQSSRFNKALCFAVFAGLVPASAVQAQEMVSRPVVQSLGSPEVQDLGTALRRLAQRPRDLSALLAAGSASLAVDDLEAAMGFYGRAQEVAPADPRVKFGMASVFLRSGRPVPALELFGAIAASGFPIEGSSGAQLRRDRGLAYDLVGDTERARADYTAALSANGNDADTVQRLAINHAISGNNAAFEDTLRPLLAQSDPAAFRTRAFGLAIMGEQARAASIVNEVMPRDLASRLTPYLAFMPRLTPSQQAAAANLGIFPRAADIGRDDPAIAQYRGEGGAAGRIAAGERAQTAAPAIAGGADARLAPVGAPLGTAAPQTASRGTSAPNQTGPQVAEPAKTGPTLIYSSAPSQASTQPPKPPPPKANVADAFADIGTSVAASQTRGDAVDLNAIDVPREVAASAPGPQAIAPRRFWVQVATGRDVSALRFDWRRIKRTAPDILGPFEAHVTAWGEANRLLAGPVESAGKARAMVNDLKEKGLDTFTYTSPEGTEIKELAPR